MIAIRRPDAALLRFTLVAVGGLLIDVAIAWLLADKAGFPLPAAALCGFVCGALANYVAHERWTFGHGALSARRGFAYLATTGFVLALRVGSVALLRAVLPLAGSLPILVAATGVSFTANYLLSRRVVFTPATRPGGDAGR